MDFQDVSLLISFVTSPNTETTSKFFERYFKKADTPIFKKYKESLTTYFKDNDTYDDNNDIEKLLYEPNGYLLLGKFDLLILTLTDDIEFATRSFRPYSTTEYTNDFSPKNFDFQVFSTLTTSINNVDFFSKYSLINDINFQKENPFISITQLKLNPSLLIGNGSAYLESILNSIDEIFEKINSENPHHKIEYLYTINLGSHEIMLLQFSSSTTLISTSIYSIRELNINQVLENDEFKGKSTLFEFNDKLIKDISLMNNHVFVDTISNFGVCLNFLNNELNKDIKLDIKNLNLSTKWFIKPGHFKTAYNAIKEELHKINLGKNIQPMLSIGRGDMVVQPMINFNEDINLFLQYIELLNSKKDNEFIYNNIRESITSVSYELDERILDIKNNDSVHPFLIDDWLEMFCTIDPISISVVVEKLKKINAPKILAEKISSICNIYNNVIQDPVLFGSFIELEAYIKLQILKKIDDASKPHNHSFLSKKTNREFIKELRDNSVKFEHAFYDRFFQTHRTSELTDINLDYKGAIHQLLSSYDALFKYYSYEVRLNSKEYPYKVSPYSSKTFTIAPQIVFISDKIGISSTKNSLRINQQHLFQPYIYLSVFIHEICNFMMYSIMRFLYKNDEVKFNRYSKFFNKLNFPDKQLYNNTDSNFINIKEIVDDISCKNEVKIIISLISAHEDYFSYMYVDILTLSLSFNKNIDQYKYWHINYLLFQANQLHSDIHVISKKNYALIYFRLFMVYYISGNEITENLIENIIKQTPDFYVKQQDINSYKEFLLDVKDAATVIFNEPQLADFFSIIKEVNESVYNDYDFDRNLENDIKYTKENNDELDSFKNRIDEFLLLDINNNEKSYKSKLLDVIRNYIYIFHAYNGYNKNSISIIERDKITGKIIDMGEGKSKLNSFADFCFDSQGGMFTTSSKIRRKIHLARSYIYLALWDFTQKYKKDYF